MKDKKYRFENIQIYESDEVESHLNKMASKGWKLEKITQLYWKYRKIEPQDLQYAVTYFSEASEFNPHPTENQETFYDYCNAARWTFITQWHQMQIFCTESSSPIAIETDEGIKLKTIHRSMKKNFLPSAFLLLSIAIFQLLVTLFLVWINPIYAFSSNIIIFNSLAWFILLVSYLVQIIGYYHWRKASKKSRNSKKNNGYYCNVIYICDHNSFAKYGI